MPEKNRSTAILISVLDDVCTETTRSLTSQLTQLVAGASTIEEDQITEGVNEAVATVREADSKKSARGGARHRNIIDCKILYTSRIRFFSCLTSKKEGNHMSYR